MVLGTFWAKTGKKTVKKGAFWTRGFKLKNFRFAIDDFSFVYSMSYVVCSRGNF